MTTRESGITVSEKTWARMPFVFLLALLSLTGSSAWWVASLRGEVDDLHRTTGEQELRLRKIEEAQQQLALVARDVDWMRKQMERTYQTASYEKNGR